MNEPIIVRLGDMVNIQGEYFRLVEVLKGHNEHSTVIFEPITKEIERMDNE